MSSTNAPTFDANKTFKDNLADHPNLASRLRGKEGSPEYSMIFRNYLEDWASWFRTADQAEGCTDFLLLKRLFNKLNLSVNRVIENILEKKSEDEYLDYERCLIQARDEKKKTNDSMVITNFSSVKFKLEDLADGEDIHYFVDNSTTFFFIHPKGKRTGGNYANIIQKALAYYGKNPYSESNVTTMIPIKLLNNWDISCVASIKLNKHEYVSWTLNPEHFMDIVGNTGEAMLVGYVFCSMIQDAYNYLSTHKNLVKYRLSDKEKEAIKLNDKLKTGESLSNQEKQIYNEHYKPQIFLEYNCQDAGQQSEVLAREDEHYNKLLEEIQTFATTFSVSLAKKISTSGKLIDAFKKLLVAFIELNNFLPVPLNRELYYGSKLSANAEKNLAAYGIRDVGGFQVAMFGKRLPPGKLDFLIYTSLSFLNNYELSSALRNYPLHKNLRFANLLMLVIPDEMWRWNSMPKNVCLYLRLIRELSYNNEPLILQAAHRDFTDKKKKEYVFGLAKNTINYCCWWILKGHREYIRDFISIINTFEPLAYYPQLTQIQNLVNRQDFDFANVDMSSEDKDILTDDQLKEIIYELALKRYLDPLSYVSFDKTKCQINNQAINFTQEFYKALGITFPNDFKLLDQDELLKLRELEKDKYNTYIRTLNNLKRDLIPSDKINLEMITILFNNITSSQDDYISEQNKQFKKTKEQSLYKVGSNVWDKTFKKLGLPALSSVQFEAGAGMTLSSDGSYVSYKGEVVSIDPDSKVFEIKLENGDIISIDRVSNPIRQEGNTRHQESETNINNNYWEKLTKGVNLPSDSGNYFMSDTKADRTYRWYLTHELSSQELEYAVNSGRIISNFNMSDKQKFKDNYDKLFKTNKDKLITSLHPGWKLYDDKLMQTSSSGNRSSTSNPYIPPHVRVNNNNNFRSPFPVTNLSFDMNDNPSSSHSTNRNNDSRQSGSPRTRNINNHENSGTHEASNQAKLKKPLRESLNNQENISYQPGYNNNKKEPGTKKTTDSVKSNGNIDLQQKKSNNTSSNQSTHQEPNIQNYNNSRFSKEINAQEAELFIGALEILESDDDFDLTRENLIEMLESDKELVDYLSESHREQLINMFDLPNVNEALTKSIDITKDDVTNLFIKDSSGHYDTSSYLVNLVTVDTEAFKNLIDLNKINNILMKKKNELESEKTTILDLHNAYLAGGEESAKFLKYRESQSSPRESRYSDFRDSKIHVEVNDVEIRKSLDTIKDEINLLADKYKERRKTYNHFAAFGKKL